LTSVLSLELASAQIHGDWYGPPSFTVLYDQRCPLCRRLKSWLGSQATLVPIEFVSSGSTEARNRYPNLDHERTMTNLTVVATNGAVFEGERAWLACAWALPRWRPVAEHLGSRPALLAVKVIARAVGRHRRRNLTGLYGPGCETRGLSPSTPPTHRG